MAVVLGLNGGIETEHHSERIATRRDGQLFGQRSGRGSRRFEARVV